MIDKCIRFAVTLQIFKGAYAPAYRRFFYACFTIPRYGFRFRKERSLGVCSELKSTGFFMPKTV
jgi:hypothetical protein